MDRILRKGVVEKHTVKKGVGGEWCHKGVLYYGLVISICIMCDRHADCPTGYFYVLRIKILYTRRSYFGLVILYAVFCQILHITHRHSEG